MYCTQLNAMMGFAWVQAYAISHLHDCSRSLMKNSRILVTISIIIVLLLGIASARRGDGYQGQLVTA